MTSHTSSHTAPWCSSFTSFMRRRAYMHMCTALRYADSDLSQLSGCCCCWVRIQPLLLLSLMTDLARPPPRGLEGGCLSGPESGHVLCDDHALRVPMRHAHRL